MKQSENTQPEEKVVTSYKKELLQVSFEYAAEQTKNIKSERKREATDLSSSFDFRSGYNAATASLIQTIENRVKELESVPHGWQDSDRVTVIEELINLLTTLKS